MRVRAVSAADLLHTLAQHEREHAELARAKGHIVMGEDLDLPPLPGPSRPHPETRISVHHAPAYEEIREFFDDRTFAAYPAANDSILYVDDCGRMDGQTFNPDAAQLTGHLVCGKAWILMGQAKAEDTGEL